MTIPPSSSHPTALIIFGATGDVVAKKLIPSVFQLFTAGKLPPKFRVIGFSRRDWSDADFRAHVSDMVKARPELQATEEQLHAFARLFFFAHGIFDRAEDYALLHQKLEILNAEWGVNANILLSLAVPPHLYETILPHLAAAGFANDGAGKHGWTRMLVEKPIGMNAASSEALDLLMSRLFREDQVYRIEHYLAKEMLRNVLVFRFGNNVFEEGWNQTAIEHMHVRLWEKIGVESRGAFYDHVGALRDVGQNHLLQMLALVTMDRPSAFEAEAIRAKRTELLRALRPIAPERMAQQTFRAQHEGYKQIAGVAPDSSTETYFAATSFIDHPRWRNMPFTIEAGKRMGEARKEIEILFRHPLPCQCPSNAHQRNRLLITLEPQEGITIDLWAKKPGHAWETEKRSFSFLLREAHERIQYTEEYQKVLLDAIGGDQTIFISTEELRAMWAFVDPIQKAWQENRVPLHSYAPNTSAVAQKAQTHFAMTASDKSRGHMGMVGLGKMGAGLARNLIEHGWSVTGFNRTFETAKAMEKEGLRPAKTLKELVADLPAPRVVWLMVPAGPAVDDMLFGTAGLAHMLEAGDTIIEGGNSHYVDAAPRAERLAKLGIAYMDVGVSGGPAGARRGACLMIGGARRVFEKWEPLFRSAALPGGYRFFEGAGAGHFVKMVHNGIEYGMMQALAEGFHILKASPFDLRLTDVAELYDRGSVIESRLTHWLFNAFAKRGENLDGVSGTVNHTGEAAWTVEAAKWLKVNAANIEQSLQFRKDSAAHPDYTGQILSALREQFGGHSVK